MRKEEGKPMVDDRENQYAMNNQGFVAPVPEQAEEESEGSENQAQG